MSETTLYNDPMLYAWFSAAAAYNDTANARIIDRGPNNLHWKAPVGATLPALTANWRGTGYEARTFDGTDDYLEADFLFPAGPFSVLLVADIAAGAGSEIALCATLDADPAWRWYFELLSGGPRAASAADTSAKSSTLVTATPSIVAYVMDSATGALACATNGEAWVSTLAPPQQLSGGTSAAQLGALGGVNGGRVIYYKGAIAEALVFRCALTNPRYASTLADAVGTMKTKYGIA